MEAARLAAPSDVERLVELASSVRQELGGEERGGRLLIARDAPVPVDASALKGMLDRDDHIVVVGTLDDSVIGHAIGRVEIVRDGSPLGIIDELYVELGGREVGVGEAMMALLLPWFAERRCRGVDAMALPGVRATKNFFEMSGFSARLIVMHHRFDRAT